ncbi:glycosyltransferase [Marinimicrobium sp. LS-A18]|uniref:glycosyltransferase family 2 protein n=1 Tax=Marinimicrobium sp. LS-A18 TaxID=1381596 RepID=UPI0004655AB7|nr:glycosyltransferase [Marinimicrobium sp. LS-A18]
MGAGQNILATANAHFRAANYLKALELYQGAGRIYGAEVVSANIDACLTRLQSSEIQRARTLDPITRVLLNNAGEITLSEQERELSLTHYQQCVNSSPENLPVKPVAKIPPDWPEDLKLAPLPESTNDFEWYKQYRYSGRQSPVVNVGLSVVVPTFNRSRILDVTLACLVKQRTEFNYEVIVADDGSNEDLTPLIRRYESLLDIKYVRQRDYGYQLCAVRNLGLRTAKYPFVSILDCDMAPGQSWVQSYVQALIECEDVALIGPRKYVDTHGISGRQVLENSGMVERLPEVRTNNDVGNKINGEISVDWRLEHFHKTDNLRLCDTPFRFFSGGNVAFSKKWLEIAGWFDEEFTHWGGEDNEFGYRLYRSGCFFKALEGGMAYHQEPPGKENETDRAAGKAITIKIVQEKVPYFYRKLKPIKESIIHRVPLVSIYIPAFNCEGSIKRCIDSALNQTITDLEVCVCDDGSTDGTLDVLKAHYGLNPRVRFVTQKNGGIGRASNTAVNLCRGFYIGQLDSDDYLEPKAVELCLKEFQRDKQLACVYTGNRNVNPDGSLIANGYNRPEYSREKLTSAMICHHFRMFSARAWSLTSGFDEHITNAVDYDMYLKLSEVGPFRHINLICYNRVLHGENTSIKKLGEQKRNHFLVVNSSLERQGVRLYRYRSITEDKSCRKYFFEKNYL